MDSPSTTLSTPLIDVSVETAVPYCNNHRHHDHHDSHHDHQQKRQTTSTKSTKVHRLACFLLGNATGIFMQIVSVVVFTHMMMVSKSASSSSSSTTTSSTSSDASSSGISQQINDGWVFHCATWMIYHLSLGVYLVLWSGMMVLAVSKTGWKFLKHTLQCWSTRRTCFLQLFFFINGFVQGSLMPWICLEVYMGHPSLDVYWMPTTHLVVFLAVVSIYDWFSDEVVAVPNSSSTKNASVNDYSQEDEESASSDDSDDDESTNFLV